MAEMNHHLSIRFVAQRISAHQGSGRISRPGSRVGRGRNSFSIAGHARKFEGKSNSKDTKMQVGAFKPLDPGHTGTFKKKKKKKKKK
jgi:hypothetical protein